MDNRKSNFEKGKSSNNIFSDTMPYASKSQDRAPQRGIIDYQQQDRENSKLRQKATFGNVKN
jgi:hypothetical protein